MKNVDLDLGQTSKEMYGEPTGTLTKSDEPDRKHYPSFHYEGPEELPIPDQGKMTVEYAIVRSTNSKDRDGKEHYSCDVEIREICCVDKGVEQPTKRDTSTEDALDRLMDVLRGESEEGGEE